MTSYNRSNVGRLTMFQVSMRYDSIFNAQDALRKVLSREMLHSAGVGPCQDVDGKVIPGEFQVWVSVYTADAGERAYEVLRQFDPIGGEFAA